MNINNNKTYYDYIDGNLNAEEILAFEEFINKNPEANEKLKNLIDRERKLDNYLNDPDKDDFIFAYGLGFLGTGGLNGIKLGW